MARGNLFESFEVVGKVKQQVVILSYGKILGNGYNNGDIGIDHEIADKVKIRLLGCR